MMKAEDWADFPGVIKLEVGEELPEATIPKEDKDGKPYSWIENGIKYLVRSAYFSNNIYIQPVELKKKNKHAGRAEVRQQSEESVKAAREQVRKEAQELIDRHRKRTA